jgi:hypothetical protein
LGTRPKCGLTKKIFSKEERIKAKSRIKKIKIVEEDLTSKAVADNVTALQGTIDSTLKNLQYTQTIGYLVTVLGVLTTLYRYFGK